jgi:hypothetical protein
MSAKEPSSKIKKWYDNLISYNKLIKNR